MGKKRDDRRQADEITMEWSDFTNAVLTRMGLFVLMPCVIVGSVLMILKFGVGAVLSMIVLCLGFAFTVLVYWLVDAICNCIRFRKARRALEKEADTK